MKNILLLFCTLLISSGIFAQEYLHCGTDEMRISTLQKNPEIAKAIVERDKSLEIFTRRFITEKKGKDIDSDTALYIIPVVFHIIHNYGTENISNNQIYSAIDILNKTFRKQRDDTSIISEVFKPLHADTRIEFRLAKKDPNGNCHSGINRIASTLSNIGDHRVKTLIQWEPSKYLNVYVVKNAAGLAGHSIFPSDADTIPAWDGIVIAHNYVGSIGTSNLTQSVALAHECGHYLNLQHTWGGNNVPGYYYLPCADPQHDCNMDDMVEDTPPTIGWQTCNLNGVSCSNALDMVQNVMDYSYCNIMFTTGQKDRMQAALNSLIGNRNNLWQPANLLATGVYDAPVLCAADFTSSKKVTCMGETITFYNESYQPPFDSILWTCPGGTPSNSTMDEPEVTYNFVGHNNVSLTIFKNGNSITETKNNFISVLPETTANFPYSESFENETQSLEATNWFKNSFDEENDWNIIDSMAYSGSQCVMLSNFNNTMDTKDELYSPLINLSQASAVNIAFKYAFAGKTSEINDELQVQINKGCSGFWLIKLRLDSAELETTTPQTNPFSPASLQEWKQAVVSIPSSYFVDDFRFKFVFSSRGGNNVFIDDVNIDVSAGMEEELLNENKMIVFPNPSEGLINIEIPTNSGAIKECKLFDTKGSLVEATSATKEVDVSSLARGMYFIFIYTERGIFRQRIVKE